MQKYFEVGQIVNTFGINGVVKVKPFTDEIERFEELKFVLIEKNNQLVKYEIKEVKYQKQMVLLKLNGIDNMNQAETFKGCYLKIERKYAKKLPEDTYFIADLIGLNVYTDEGKLLGRLEDIYNSVVVNDITNKHQISNIDLFNRVVRFIVENVGKTFSANSIVNFLKSEKRSISVEAIYNYLEWLEKAFVIYRCKRYDLRGKNVLKTQEKFYLADQSIKYALYGFNPTSIASMLENLVFFELKRRGYDVFIGKNADKEIDFVAIKRDDKLYVQVCRELPKESDREIANLMEIKDHFPKMVVTLDDYASGNVNGIKIVHLVDFLLDENI